MKDQKVFWNNNFTCERSARPASEGAATLCFSQHEHSREEVRQVDQQMNAPGEDPLVGTVVLPNTSEPLIPPLIFKSKICFFLVIYEYL